jgi:hypothetical protein
VSARAAVFPRLAGLLGCIAAGVAAATPAAAQLGPWATGVELNDDRPAWARAWSPLHPIADLPRRATTAPPLPELLQLPAPRVGLFWTAANPAGLPFELDDARADFRFAHAAASGAYRRPLDPAVERVQGVVGDGWRTLGERGAAVGRIAVEQVAHDPGSNASMLSHHLSSPLLLTDSLTPEIARVNVRMEAAGGWRAGPWGFGVTAGYSVIDNRSRGGTVFRSGRAVLPAAGIGVTRAFGPALRVGLSGRRSASRETMSLLTRTEFTNAFVWRGFFEPDAMAVTPTSPGYRRAEADAWQVGLGAAGRWRAADWAAFAARTSLADRQFTARRADPPTDTWDAAGRTAGAAIALPLGARTRATADASWTSLAGHTERHDLDGVVFRGEESAAGLGVSLRRDPAPAAWGAAASVSLGRARRLHRDILAELNTETVTWNPGGALEIARPVGRRLTLGAGYGAAFHAGNVNAPGAGDQVELFRQVFVPELAFTGSEALTHRLAVTGRWATGPASAVFARTSLGRTAPLGERMWPDVAPLGSRSAWTFALGASW